MHRNDGRFDVFRKELSERLEVAMRELRRYRRRWARTFQLREVQGLPRKVVAQMLGLSRVQTVNDRVRQAKEYLRTQLPPKEDLL